MKRYVEIRTFHTIARKTKKGVFMHASHHFCFFHTMLSSLQAIFLLMSCLLRPSGAFLCTSSHSLLKIATKRGLSSLLTTPAAVTNQHLLSVAPMMDYTDKHQRYLQRLLSKQTVLYTEMVTTMALVRSGNPQRFLRAELETEDPLVLQLGGSDVPEMKEAAKMAQEYGYKEINLNVGCPSEKVSGAGCFGAVLYLNPQLVAQLALSVAEATGTPATVKCRIGVDNHETYEELCNFIRTVSETAGVTHFIVHARIAVLGKKFTPKDNRSIPPLKYDVVYKLLQDFPHMKFTLNGGVGSIEQVQTLLAEQPLLHGVMVGRAVVNDPFGWSKADSLLYNQEDPGLARNEVLLKYAQYCEREQKLERRTFTRTLIKPVQGLFHSQTAGKVFRRALDTGCINKLSAHDVIMYAYEQLHTAEREIASYMAQSHSASTQSIVQEV